MVIVLHYPKREERVTVPDTWSRLEVELLVIQSKAVCYEVEETKK